MLSQHIASLVFNYCTFSTQLKLCTVCTNYFDEICNKIVIERGRTYKKLQFLAIENNFKKSSDICIRGMYNGPKCRCGNKFDSTNACSECMSPSFWNLPVREMRCIIIPQHRRIFLIHPNRNYVYVETSNVCNKLIDKDKIFISYTIDGIMTIVNWCIKNCCIAYLW